MTVTDAKPAREHDDVLEGLRGMAALMVACSHAFFLAYLAPRYPIPEWCRMLEGGHAGVLLFFCLSGFVVTWTNRAEFSAAAVRRYGWRRVVRLAPIYYLAVALTFVVIAALGRHEAASSLAATLAGLQNYNPYFGLALDPLVTNGPLWSLNYEILYYFCFVVLWRFKPGLAAVFVPALAAGIAGWFLPVHFPLFLASYACGWIFWAAGWWLARQPLADDQPLAGWSIACGLMLVFATQRIDGLARVFNALGWYSNDSGMVTLADLGRLPAMLVTLAAVTRRRLPGARFWIAAAWILLLLPEAGMIATGRLAGNVGWIIGVIATAVAVPLAFVQGRGWLARLAPFGQVSYAFYVVHFPLLFVVGALPLPDGTAGSFVLRVALWFALAVALAWLLERKLQPILKARLLPRRAAVA